MDSTVLVPITWIESIVDLRLPSKTNRRLQQLMVRNNEGQLSESERGEFEALVDLSESFSVVRAEALRLLGRAPQ